MNAAAAAKTQEFEFTDPRAVEAKFAELQRDGWRPGAILLKQRFILLQRGPGETATIRWS